MQFSQILPGMGGDAPGPSASERRDRSDSSERKDSFPSAQDRAREAQGREGERSSGDGGSKLPSAETNVAKDLNGGLDLDLEKLEQAKIRLIDSDGEKIPLEDIEGLDLEKLLALLGEEGRVELSFGDGEELSFALAELPSDSLKPILDGVMPFSEGDEAEFGEQWIPALMSGNNGSGQGSSSTVLQGISSGSEMGTGRGARAELLSMLQDAIAARQNGSEQSDDRRSESQRLSGLERGGEAANRASQNDAQGILQSMAGRSADPREPGMGLRQYTTSVETPVQQQRQWSEQVAGKISWLAGKHIQSADIHLNPPEMGPIEVRVQVQNDQAAVTVHSQNPAVREMLELNSQRLREMLEENGMDLSQFDVSDQTAGGSDGEGSDRDQRDGGANDGPLVSQAGESVTTGEMQIQWTGGVDTYA